ncbi:hypothetical protein QA645_19490 [Bradyrhizobium sp. CIAT3101]|uniref:hypothetical protein n=1 Tax=Bradyrhizobium sp. CIAT3101 TaxID=439387 RepID=UPI0024B11828|nr:hypothetical protein [Bradyrhizobium sp. CIAT3101]WFU84840.1 hypothetical protein QA645_19490 [Bradyrhizobium sp. CIAT3101]
MKRQSRSEASRERSRAKANEYWADPAARAAHSEKTKVRMADPEVRATISERTRAAMVRPEVRGRVIDRSSDPNWRQRVSENTRAAMADSEVRKRISDRTKAGIAAKAMQEKDQLRLLEDAWGTSSTSVKRRFLEMCLSGSDAGDAAVGPKLR